MKKTIIIAAIVISVVAFGVNVNAALLRPNTPGGLLSPFITDLVNAVTGVLGYANGGSATSTTPTAGSVIFAGTSSLDQNNANLFWSKTLLRLGIGTPNPSSTVHVNGSMSIKRTTKNSSSTIDSTDHYVAVVSTSSPITLTLPSATSSGPGRLLTIKDEGGNASSSNITIDTATSSQSIDGAATSSISTNYGIIRLISSGLNWFTL